MPKVSFIITTYNVENYVATALQSALDAMPEEAEIIVVDDGSDDMTPTILQTLAKALGPRAPLRLYLFSQNTIGGTASASNFGIDKAQGDFVVFLDGDDWVLPAALHNALGKMAAQNLDFLMLDCAEYWNDTGTYTQHPEDHLWQALQTEADDIARRALLLKMPPFPWRKIYRRSFLRDCNVRFPVGDYFFEDNPFHWQAVLKARSWGLHREITHIHRMARPGQSLDRRGSAYLRIFDHFDTMQNLVDSQPAPGRWQAALLGWLLQHIIWSSAHTLPGDWNDLYVAARDRLACFEQDAFHTATQHSDFPPEDLRKLKALARRDRRGFLQEFSPEPAL